MNSFHLARKGTSADFLWAH